MNKKGFTLVELLVTIALIAIVAIIAIPKVMDTINTSKIELYKEQENRLKEATIKYLNDNYVSSRENNIIVQKTSLVSGGYVNEIYDLTDEDSICDGYIQISNYSTTPHITAYISCTNYETTGFDINNIE